MLKKTYDQIRRKQLLEKGLCTRCAKVKLKPNTRVCDTCVSQTTENYRHRRHLPEVRERIRAWQKGFRDKRRREVFTHYGDRCTCCGETQHMFLEIDHINNDGYKNRLGGAALYTWIIKQNYPTDLQLLCSNCNQGKRRNGGICPHLSI